MKPFDLQAAIEGKPLITRGGKSAYFLAYLGQEGINDFNRVIYQVKGEQEISTCNTEGKLRENGQSVHDLFLASQKKWALSFRSFSSESEAQEFQLGLSNDGVRLFSHDFTIIPYED